MNNLLRLSIAVQFSDIDPKLVHNLTIRMQHEHNLWLASDKNMIPHVRKKVFMPQADRTFSQKTDYGLLLQENLFDLARKANVDLIDKLTKLQNDLYVADNMYLVIWAPDHLDNLTQAVVDTFATIPAKNTSQGNNVAKNLSDKVHYMCFVTFFIFSTKK